MAEYIEREVAKKEFNLNFGGVSHAVIANRLLDAIPAADVVPVVHGQWALGTVEPGSFTPGGNRPWICSECGYLASWMLDRPTYNYCPNCGARMDGE